MFSILEIKSRYDLTWEDLPYIESPVFAHEHAIKAIQGRDPFAPPIQNLEDFRRAEVPHYDPLSNHDYVENHLRRLFFEGQYFSVSRPKIPFAPIFKWNPLAEHPDGGEWIANPFNYSEHCTKTLEEYAKQLGAQKRRMMAEQAEASAVSGALVAGVRRVVEKTSDNKSVPKGTSQAKLPQSLDECHQRLEDARQRLIKPGYESKYTDAQVRALAQKGELDDRFVVRIIETKYAGDDGYIGQMKNGEVKYWSTTFNQMENGDTDPPTLCGLIGVEYKPKNSYTLVIIDTHAAGAGQAVTIVPTHKNLGKFAKHEIKGIKPDAVDKVMTPKYNQEYAEHIVGFKEDGLSIDKEKDIQLYADTNFTNDTDKENFESRIKIHERLGANEHYTGDGTTKNLIAGCSNECGVMETFTYDKNPQTLGQLETGGSAKRIIMEPI